MSARTAVRATALGTLAALLLAGCGSAAGGGHGPVGDLIVDGVVDQKALGAQVSSDGALSAPEREERAAELDARLERLLWTASGLEAALGGPAAADEAFAAHGEALIAAVRTQAGAPIQVSGGAGTVVRAASAPSIGEGLFGGIMAIILEAEGAVSASNGVVTPTGPEQFGENGTISGSQDRVDLSQEFTLTSHGVKTTLQLQLGISPCPDASGQFTGEATMKVWASTVDGSAGQSGVLQATVTGQVDDDAHLASSAVAMQMEWSDVSDSGVSLAQVSASFGGAEPTTAEVRTMAGSSGAQLAKDALTLGMLYSLMIKEKVSEAAEKGWQSGRCVSLSPTGSAGPSGLDPGAVVMITAAPRSTVDGGPAGGTVTAVLSSGGASVAPQGQKVKADATFTFTAPEKKDASGTVDLEARSRRGVATASMTLDTKSRGYSASGGGARMSISGTVADVAAVFTLHGTGDGFTVEFTYTPSGATGGSVSYTGAGGGFSMQGTGTYTLADAGGGVLTLSQTENGCVKGGGCATTSDVVTLTPLD